MSWLENLESTLTGCNTCKWKNTRHQKCTCCARNQSIKDNYEKKEEISDGASESNNNK